MKKMKTIRVAAAIIKKDNAIFATQRGYGDFKDYWEFPGGKIEPGESPEEALHREIMEELKVTVGIDAHLTRVEYDYPDFHLSMDCFLCHLESGKLTLTGSLGAEPATSSGIKGSDGDWEAAEDSCEGCTPLSVC